MGTPSRERSRTRQIGRREIAASAAYSTLSPNQLLGQIGETAVQLRFLTIGFQFDVRARLEAGIDGVAEVMDKGRPLARMIAVQIKSTEAGKYASEDASGFTYLLRTADLAYWSGTNHYRALPEIR